MRAAALLTMTCLLLTLLLAPILITSRHATPPSAVVPAPTAPPTPTASLASTTPLASTAASAGTAPPAPTAPIPYRQNLPSTWAGIDALHRSLPHPPLAPSLQLNRTVGIFYFLWLERKWPGPWDNSVLLAAAGGDRHKVKYGPLSAYHWGQPQLGYYLSEDQWVMRKHASMLADAGVDFICFDVTNAAHVRRRVGRSCWPCSRT